MRKIKTREGWLREMAKILNRSLFKRSVLDTMPVVKVRGKPLCGVELEKPDLNKIQFNMAYSPNQRVGVRQVGKNKVDAKVKHIGLCCHPHSIGKQSFGSEIFIVPSLKDPVKIVGVLIHELIHVMTRGHGHKGAFKWVGESVGLTGSMTATGESKELKEKIAGWIDKIGAFPHKQWIPSTNLKKQSTRLIKVHCERDDHSPYIIRMSRATIEKHGTPNCPAYDYHGEVCEAELVPEGYTSRIGDINYEYGNQEIQV